MEQRSRLTHLTASQPGVTSNVVSAGSFARIRVKSSCETLVDQLERDASETSPMNLTPDLPWKTRGQRFQDLAQDARDQSQI